MEGRKTRNHSVSQNREEKETNVSRRDFTRLYSLFEFQEKVRDNERKKQKRVKEKDPLYAQDFGNNK
jgi:hypothetical protein